MARPAGGCGRGLAVLAVALAHLLVTPVAGAEGEGPMARAGNQEPIDAGAWRTPRPGHPLVIAHRGYSEKHTDNSRAAFEAAIAAGADLIETDIRLSRDGILVCVHDREVDGDEVGELTWAQLSRKGIMRLADVLALAKGRIAVLLDIKLREDKFPVRVFEAVRRTKMAHQVIFGVREIPQVGALRAQAPTVVILGFIRNYERFPEFFDAGGDIARLWEEDLNEKNLALARGGTGAGGHPVFVTAGLRDSGENPGDVSAPRFQTLMKKGIDGVLVNDPLLALKARGYAPK